jgi:hypothetical protein
VSEADTAGLSIFDFSERFYDPGRRHSTLGNSSPADHGLAPATATS